jgi:integrase
MAKARITKRLVDTLKPTMSDFTMFDTALVGFGVRVRATGGMSYIVQYKGGTGRGAPTRRVTLGGVGKMTPEQARKAAEKVLGLVASGEDPAADKRRERRNLPLADVIPVFLKDHMEAKRKASTAAAYRDLLERIVSRSIGHMKANAVTRQDIARLHSSLRKTPVTANRALAAISSLYTFASKAGYVVEGYNPAQGVEKYPEKARERFLSKEELARLGDALREGETIGLPYEVDDTKPKAKHAPKGDKRRVKLDPYAVAAIRLLILTGARLREILHAKWEHVDFERDILFLPDSKTGRKPLYLNAPALELLSGLPRIEGNPHIIAGMKDGAPRADLKKPWAAVTRAAHLEGVRIHDLRHSFASIGAGASLGLPIIGKLLGHTQAATTHRYAHLDADPMRRAAETIGATIAAAMGDGEAGKVVNLTKRRG